jgi:RNA chaperone Hfq
MTEDEFLNARIMDKKPIYCFLANGVRLQGTIYENDFDVIFIKPLESEDDAGLIMTFKQQISSIMPISARYVSQGLPHDVNGVLRGRTTGRN